MQRLVVPRAEIAWKSIQRELVKADSSKFYDRLYAVSLICEGMSCSCAAQILDENIRTVQRWTAQFLEQGIDGLRDGDHPGRTRRMSDDQRAQLAKMLSEYRRPDGPMPKRIGPRQFRELKWSPDSLARVIAEHFGIQMGKRQCQRLLNEFCPLRFRR
jgi:transposase